jgi:hypothetical protein
MEHRPVDVLRKKKVLQNYKYLDKLSKQSAKTTKSLEPT